MVEIIDIATKAFLLGISTGPFCSTTCLPLLIPALFSRRQNRIVPVTMALFRFLAGRFFAYLLFGVVTGLAGIYLNESDIFRNVLIPAIYIIIGLAMIIYGFVGVFKHYGSCRKIDKKFQNPNYLFVLGFLMGINFCPPFILAIGASTGLQSVMSSVLFFSVFFFATSLFFLPLMFSGFAAKISLINKIAKYASIVAGFYFLYLAIEIILAMAGVIEFSY